MKTSMAFFLILFTAGMCFSQNNDQKNTNAVSIVDVGSAASAYTYGQQNGAATMLWYDHNIHTIVHAHRMGGPVGPPEQNPGSLSYDISTDNGITWTSQVEIVNADSTGFWSHSQQIGIFNPEGNPNPEDAWVTFFSTATESVGLLYGYGVASIGNPGDTSLKVLPPDPPQGFFHGAPSGFTMIEGETTWAAAPAIDGANYTNNLILLRGTFNSIINDVAYEEFLVPAACNYARPLRIAFSPDGQTGYIYWNGNNGSFPELEGWDYPLLLKTTDGGETWSEELISIKLGGADGIDAIKNYLTDQQIIDIFGELIHRDSIKYTTPWFNSDISVDIFGNPHLAASVFVAGEEGELITEPETMGVFDIYTVNGNDEDWHAVQLGALKTYIGSYGEDEMIEYNRLQASSNPEGTKLFFTWNDTRLTGIDDNTHPDIYARGFDLQANKITDGDDVSGASNVTANSEGLWEARFHVLSPLVIEDEGSYTLPLTYMEMYDDLDPGLPVQFKYIQDFSFSTDDFTVSTGNPDFPNVGIGESNSGNGLKISQNSPNPAATHTEIRISLKEAAPLKVLVTSMSGQIVLELDEGFVDAGNRIINLDISKLPDGVYFYSIYAGNSKLTKKMIVE